MNRIIKMNRSITGVIILLLLPLLLFTGVAPAAPVALAAREKENSIPQTLEELETRIKEVLSETNTPGAAVVLTSKDEVLWIGAMGIADVEEERPVTEETMFRVGSISKSFTGLTMLKLQEKGLLKLEDPLGELVPGLSEDNPWEDTNPLRLVHLLEHTAGYDDMSLRESVISDPDITLEKALKINPGNREVRWTPGKHASYSNIGPAVAAHAAEEVTGKSFEDIVQDYLLAPLKMETASFSLTPVARERLSKSYGPDGISEIPYSHIIYRPSGSLNVTPREMANFIQMLLNRGTYQGENLLSRESIQRFERPETALSVEQGLQMMGFGPGSFKSLEEGFVFAGHDGGIDGFLSSYGYLPEHGLGYFCSLNSPNGAAFVEILRLTRGYLARDLEKTVPPEAVALSPQELAQYTGYYETYTPRMEVSRFLEVILGLTRLEQEKGNLYIRSLMGGSNELVPVGEGKFRGPEDPVATTVFIPGEDGGWFLQGYGGPVSVNLRSIPPWRYWARLGLTVVSFLLMASSLLFTLVWVPLKIFGKLREEKYLSLRLMPLLPALTFLGIALLLILSTATGGNPMEMFGNLTVWSIGLFLLTLLFGLTSLAALVQSIRAWRWEVSTPLRVYSLLVSLANMTVTLYLAYWGIIGFRIWA